MGILPVIRPTRRCLGGYCINLLPFIANIRGGPDRTDTGWKPMVHCSPEGQAGANFHGIRPALLYCPKTRFLLRSAFTEICLKGAVVVPQRAVMEVQGQLSACDRRRGWEGGNPSRAGRAPRGNGPGDHLGTQGRRKGNRGGNSEVKSGVPVVAKLWTPNAERSAPEVENETRRVMCGAARSAHRPSQAPA
jgi:hypothetical protein